MRRGAVCLVACLLHWSAASAESPRPVLGIYAVPAAACSLLAAVGFSVVHSYDFELPMPPDSSAYVSKARAYLDAADGHGLQVLLGVPRNWLAERLDSPVRAVIRSLRAHPALLAWYEDEVAQNGDVGAVEFLARIVDEMDREHGLVIEEALRDDRLVDLPRVRMFTYYPVTERSRRGWQLQTLPERFPVDKLRVPFWPVLQAFGRDLISGPARHSLLVPTAAELEFSLNSALIAGARGIFFYPYLHPTVYDAAKAAQGGWGYGKYRPLPEIAPTLWGSVVGCAGRARVLLEMLRAAPASRELVPISMPRDVQLGQWRTERGTLLLLANPSRARRTIRLRTGTPLAGGEELEGTKWVPRPGLVGSELRLDIPGPGARVLLLRTVP